MSPRPENPLPSATPVAPGSVGSAGPVPERLREAVRLARQNLLHLQNPDGHWAGELIVDSTLCSDLILYLHWSGKVDPVLQEKCVAHIRRRQLEDGGWNIYFDGPSEINATVKAYFALKLAGDDPKAPWMQKARATALRLGGIPRMNTYAKLYLALLGQFPWASLPTIPPEIILLPRWFPFNLAEISSWTRAMIIPLAILNHLKPTRPVPPEKQLHELYPAGTEAANLLPRPDPKLLTWRNFFLGVDRMLKWIDRIGFHPLRDFAVEESLSWMLTRMGKESDGLAAVFPAMLNAIIALEALGHDESHPLLAKAIRDFEGLYVDDPEDFRIQPCLSPVWDTAINIIALTESEPTADGTPPATEAVRKATRWLVEREVRIKGDWTAKNAHPEASGWAFEYRNDYYPDTDDTMMVLMALRFAPEEGGVDEALMHRALGWLLSFQCRDGGWAAFDKDVTRHWLNAVPFADHNAITDPTCSDLTGRMLELLGYLGFDRAHPQVRHAVEHLQRTQEPDGSWYGRWGVNYLYGTWQVLRGLRSIGEPMTQEWIVRARDWVESCQNSDGGWGESPATYHDPALKGRGPSTASQTAWALMGLCACNDLERPSIQRGVEYLIRTQNRDGSWTEPHTTGTGFPRVFYLNYDMYRNNFPLLALTTYANYRTGRFHVPGRFRVQSG